MSTSFSLKDYQALENNICKLLEKRFIQKSILPQVFISQLFWHGKRKMALTEWLWSNGSHISSVLDRIAMVFHCTESLIANLLVHPQSDHFLLLHSGEQHPLWRKMKLISCKRSGEVSSTKTFQAKLQQQIPLLRNINRTSRTQNV